MNIFKLLQRCFVNYIFAIGLFIPVSLCWASEQYQIGVYYFPGWKANQAGSAYKEPWEPIKPYSEREPLLGWYSEGDVAIAEQQIEWMHQYGIDYVIYDWYWSPKNTVLLDQGISAFLKAKNNRLEKFSILWANHSEVPRNIDQFFSMVNYWVKFYFSNKQYFKINWKPVVYVFSIERLRTNAQSFGKTTKELLDEAQRIAKQAGLPGIYFVGGMEYESASLNKYALDSGYSAVSAYNYHSAQGSSNRSHNYRELDADYRDHWDWAAKHSALQYIVPMTAGWNRKPWGGSDDPAHDESVSTAKTFEEHIQAAKQFIDEHRAKTWGLGVICCWNEFGEGSYIEPTQIGKFDYLEVIRGVFGSGEPSAPLSIKSTTNSRTLPQYQ